MKDIISFTENVSSLISSGLSLCDALRICVDIDPNSENKKIYKSIYDKILQGESFSSCLELYPKVFPPLYVAMIKIGEKSGDVTKVMQRLVLYLKSKKETKQKVKASLSYPFIVLITSFIVIGVIIFYVLPKLQTVFESFEDNAEQIVSNIGDIKIILLSFFIVLVFILLLVISCIVLQKKNKRFALYIDRLLFYVPFVKDYIKITNTSEFAFAMQLMCSSGFQLVEGLTQAELVVKNLYYKKEVNELKLDITNGKLLSDSLNEKKVFPKYLKTWISIGETTGGVEKVFSQVYEYYQKESARLISKIISNCEPLFILLTGIFILLIIAKFVLPIFSLLGDL